MKKSTKVVSVVLAALLLVTAVSVSVASAAGGTLASYYTTNPDNGYGKQSSIAIDGTVSDWSEDMLISTGAAWDVANNWKGAHENRLVDGYALYGAWDSTNLYIGMQYVNTTDTWATPGEQSLMENGKMGDMGLILALSVDPSSTGMNGRIDQSTGIWGVDMNFETHVDHLMYFHADLSGDPGFFSAVDSSGYTNYTTGLKSFTSAGINIKKADTNVCSHIYGLNYSNDPDDVYSETADWVDYKTYKGSKGVHNTTYDTFFEMSIPLATLGIDANYIAQNGIGAMMIGTRGASGIDSVPFDADAMLDNATGACGNDPSTSHEKDDNDVITASLARIGANGGTVVQPTTVPSTTTPVPTTTPVVSGNTTVNATSNIFNTSTFSAKAGDTVTVKYDLTSSVGVVNTQWQLTYDRTKLSLLTDLDSLSPNFPVSTNEYNNVIYAAGSKSNPTSFSSGKTFVQAQFRVLSTGTANVNLNVEELSVGYTSGGVLVYDQVVEGSALQNISSNPNFSNYSMSASSNVKKDSGSAAETFNVNVHSDFFGDSVLAVPVDSEMVTIDFRLQSNMRVMNAQWEFTYDNYALDFDTDYIDCMMPNVHSFSGYDYAVNVLRGNFADLKAANFYQDQVFISITFYVLDTNDTDVYLNMKYLGVKDGSNEYYPVEESVLDSVSGFTYDTAIESQGFDSTEFPKGDVNMDGVVNINDATLVQKAVAKIVELTPQQRILADTDYDGFDKINDVTLIQKFAAKLITSF